MRSLYVICQSPGKGKGVFATRDIKAGTIILKDRPLLKINKHPDQINEAEVLQALHQLPSEDQSKFFTLHEGNRPYKSRAFRIYKANVFGQVYSTCVFFPISFLNHSCVPNAELESQSGQECLYATKPIARGEEIYITYNSAHVGMTHAQRAGVLGRYYGFRCTCAACTQPPEERLLSDARRKLLLVLRHGLEGFYAPDLRMIDGVATMDEIAVESPEVIRGARPRPLSKPLSHKRRTAFLILCAGLFEAEGLLGAELAALYKKAAFELLNQMDGDCYTIILPAARNVVNWMTRALHVMQASRGSHSMPMKDLLETWKCMQDGDQLFGAMGFVSIRQDTSPI